MAKRPAEGETAAAADPASCVVCWDDLEDESRCYFRVVEEKVRVSGYCFSCAQRQIEEYFGRWKEQCDKADCAAMLRRMIAKGPPTTLVDADASLVLDEDERAGLFGCVVSNDRAAWSSGRLVGAPSNQAELDQLWAQLRAREQELPEKPEQDEQEEGAPAQPAK